MCLEYYWCNDCRDLVELPLEHGARGCPACGGQNLKPLHRYRSAIDKVIECPVTWEFVCHQCATYFEVPSPREPEEIRTIRCPVCASRILERLHICSLDNMARTCFG